MKTFAALTAALLIATPALAAPAPTTIVRLDDLNLAAAKDAGVLRKRVETAAARVCAASPGAQGTDAASVSAFETCRRDAIARAFADLAARNLTLARNP